MTRLGTIRIFCFVAGFLAVLAPGVRPNAPQDPPASPLKSARLVVIEAGDPGPVKVGLYIELEPGWHLYWANPGDAGLAPNVRWTLPEGFTAGPLRHPVPRKTVQEGIVSLENENPVLFLCEIAPPVSAWPAGPWQAAAVLEWMACRESCITGETPVKAGFPPDSGSLAEGKALFQRFSTRFPRPLSASGLTAGPAQAEWTGAAWRVEIALSGPRTAEARDFFVYPVDGFVVDNADVACREGKVVILLIPSRGPGAPPPSAVGGVLIIAGTGYELSSSVASRPSDSAPAGFCPTGSSRSGLILFTSWR